MGAPVWFEILETDKFFTDSPDVGCPECICSRCGQPILEEEMPIRAWSENHKFEWRYHMRCLGIISSEESDYLEFDEDLP